MPPSTTAVRLGRRGVLLGAAAVGAIAITGCTGDTPEPTASAPPGSPADPDAALRTEVAAAEDELTARYARTLAAHPDLEGVQIVGDRHASYAAAVRGAGAAAPSGTAPAPRPPKSVSAAVLALIDAEEAAARRRIGQCTDAVDPELARVLALIGAGCAAAADLLEASRSGRA